MGVLTLKESLKADPVHGSYAIPVSTQQYIYDCRTLEDSCTLEGSGVFPDTTIFVIIMSEEAGGAEPNVLVHVQLGDESMKLFSTVVTGSEAVESLKEKVDAHFNGGIEFMHDGK